VVVKSLGVTVSFAIMSVPLSLIVSLGLAILLNHKLLAGKRAFRTLFFMPVQIPLVASTFIWLGFLNGRTGWLTYILEALGLPAPDWFTSTTWALPGLALMGIWGIGNMMLIFLAGLQSVPTELYEAARVDGARRWMLFWHITLPMISPVFFYNLLISLIAAFQYFTQAYVVSNGSGDPGGSTLFFNLALYREAFVFNQMGYGSALAWLMFAIVIGLSILLFRSASRWVYYAASDR
jgi:multiple sugar transport system permease protein